MAFLFHYLILRTLLYTTIENTNVVNLFAQNPLRNSESDALMEQIKINLIKENISLLPPQEYPPLHNDEVSHLFDAINLSSWRNYDISKPQSFKKLQSCVLIRLFLLLGISQQKLYNVRIDEYNTLHNQITILGSNSNMIKYTITLPNALSDQLRFLVNFRMSFYDNDLAKAAGELLFVNRSVKSLPESYLFRLFGKVKDDYIEKYGKDTYEYRDGFNRFTPTGALKYGVIEMLKQGANPTILADFTGNGDKIMQDCQEQALSNNYSQSKYLDSFIRKAEHFD